MAITLRSNPAKIGFANLFRTEVVASQAGDVAVVKTDGMYRVGGTNNYGPVFQATGTAVAIDFTLDDPELAQKHPDRVTWSSAGTVAAGAMAIKQDFAGTAIRLTFTAAGRCVIAVN